VKCGARCSCPTVRRGRDAGARRLAGRRGGRRLPALHGHGDQPHPQACRGPDRGDAPRAGRHCRRTASRSSERTSRRAYRLQSRRRWPSGPVCTSSRPPRSGAAGSGATGRSCFIDYPHIRPRAVVHTSTAELRAARISLPALTRGATCGARPIAFPRRCRRWASRSSCSVRHARPRRSFPVRRDRDRQPGVRDRAHPRPRTMGGCWTTFAAGGLVIVQYQQYPFANGGFAPYRLSIAPSARRVTDETAPVTELDSASRGVPCPERKSRPTIGGVGCRSADCISPTIGILPTRVARGARSR